MDTQFIAPVITAIVGPIVTFIATRAYESRFLKSDPSAGLSVIDGRWFGEAHQSIGPDGTPLDATVSFNFKVKGKKVTGEGTFRSRFNNREDETSFRVSGGFLRDKVLRVEYNPENHRIFRFGAVVLQLDGDGESCTLTGAYAGWGAQTGKVVHGTLLLKRGNA